MNNTPQHSVRLRRGPIRAAFALAVAALLIVGVATASAGRSRPHVVMSDSPSAPVAGQSFSITFSLVENGTAQSIHNGSCLGMTNGKVLTLQSVTMNGTTGTCTWNIPANAGPTFDGMLAFQDSNGNSWYGGYDLPVG
jgi:hypothetical protein